MGARSWKISRYSCRWAQRCWQGRPKYQECGTAPKPASRQLYSPSERCHHRNWFLQYSDGREVSLPQSCMTGRDQKWTSRRDHWRRPMSQYWWGQANKQHMLKVWLNKPALHFYREPEVYHEHNSRTGLPERKAEQLLKPTWLQSRQPGIPRSRAKDQNWRDVVASIPTDVLIPIVVIIEPIIAVPATDLVAWRNIDMNG